MSDIDPTPYRRLASNLFSAMTRDIKAAVSRVTDLRRVQAVEDDGRVTVASTNPEAPAPETMARLRGSTYTEGDDVVTLRVAGRDIAIGTIATLADVVGDDAGPQRDPETGALPGMPVLDVLIVAVRTLKWQGANRTMSAKEQLLADHEIGQLPGLAAYVSTGKWGVRVRRVWHDTWDLDAQLAAHPDRPLATYGGQPWIPKATAQELFATYNGTTYDFPVLITSDTQMNIAAIGLTGGLWTQLKVAASQYDGERGAGMLTDSLIHEFGHQMEGRADLSGVTYWAPNTTAPNGPRRWGLHDGEERGYVNATGQRVFTQNPIRSWIDWQRTFYDSFQPWPGPFTTDGVTPTIHPSAELIPLTYVDVDHSWAASQPAPTNWPNPTAEAAAIVSGNQVINTYLNGVYVGSNPDNIDIRAGTGITVTPGQHDAGVEYVISATTSGGGSGQRIITVRDSQTSASLANPSIIDIGNGVTATPNGTDIVAIDVVYGGTGTQDAAARADHGQLAATITDLPETVQDIVAALLTPGTGIVLTYDDAGNLLTIAVSPDVTQATHYRNVDVDGYDGVNARRWSLISGTGAFASRDASDVLRASLGNNALSLSDAAGVTTTYLPNTGSPRFANAPTVGPFGTAVPVSIQGHTHTAANVTDFAEAAQDAVAAMLAAGTGVTLAYDDTANTLTITGTAGGGGGTTDPEIVRDTIGVALIGTAPISVVVNDAADTITLSTTATANSTDAQLRDRTTHTGTQAIATVTGLQSGLDAKAPLASPAFTGTPTGLSKAHVGLANVDNTADIAKAFAASQITSGVIAPARHGTGTADATTILYGDGAFRTAPPGTRVPYATTSYTFDDFIGGTNGSGNIGQIGWNTAGGNVNTPAAEANHPGIIGRNSGATANTYAWTRLIFGCMASDLFDIIYLFRLDAGSAATDTLVRLGLGTTGTANPDTDGVYLEKLAADVNWFFVTRVGGVQTRTDSGVAVAANVWIKVQMRRINGTQIGFRLATGAEVILTTNLPTISLLPFFAVMGTTTTARGLGVDFFDLQVAVTR